MLIFSLFVPLVSAYYVRPVVTRALIGKYLDSSNSKTFSFLKINVTAASLCRLQIAQVFFTPRKWNAAWCLWCIRRPIILPAHRPMLPVPLKARLSSLLALSAKSRTGSRKNLVVLNGFSVKMNVCSGDEDWSLLTQRKVSTNVLILTCKGKWCWISVYVATETLQILGGMWVKEDLEANPFVRPLE